jgi:CRP-like cAMP-binding protein
LAASQLFRDAPPMVVERIAEHVQAVSCEAGAVLCVEGETGEQMFVLAEGSVSVVVRAEGAPHRVARLAPGDAFGMVSLARGGRRMSSCVADGRAVVLRLDAAGWAALIDEPTLVGSAFRRGVIRAFAEQLRASNTQLSEWERGL